MKPAAHRNLFNVDANSWFYQYRPKSAFYRPPEHRLTARDIHNFVDLIADGGVDTLVVNSCTELAWYPSKHVPTAFDGYRRGDRSFFYGHILGHAMTPGQLDEFLRDTTTMMDRYLDLSEAGVDWLAETAKACRRRKISPWASIRMNDMHGATKIPEGSYLNGDLFKNRAMRLHGTGIDPGAPPAPVWQGLNYSKREVRDHMMALIRDAVERYDYEGLELDWTRWPLCCEPGASQAAIDTITEWHADIRRLTERQAKKNGKPFPVGIRYVGTLDQIRSIGLDLRAMAREKLIDFVEPTNSWQTSWDIPCDELPAEFGPNVAIYGVVELGPNWLHGFVPDQEGGNVALGRPRAETYRLIPACPPLMRGNAAAKLALGCDGVSVMNFMPGDSTGHWSWPKKECAGDLSALRRLDDVKTLRGKPKAYTLASQTGYWRHELFEKVGPFPCVLGAGEQRACRLPMIAEPAGKGLELVIQLVVEKKDPQPKVGVSFNGSWPRFDAKKDDRLLFPMGAMTHLTPDHAGLNIVFPVSAIREGWNDILVLHGTPKDFWSDQAKESARIESLELGVRGVSTSRARRATASSPRRSSRDAAKPRRGR